MHLTFKQYDLSFSHSLVFAGQGTSEVTPFSFSLLLPQLNECSWLLPDSLVSTKTTVVMPITIYLGFVCVKSLGTHVLYHTSTSIQLPPRNLRKSLEWAAWEQAVIISPYRKEAGHNIDKVLCKESQHFLWLDFAQQVSNEFKVSSIVLGAGAIKKNKTSLLPSKCLKTSE